MLWLTDLHLDEGGLLRQGSRQHPGVTEAGPQQHGHDKEEEDGSKHWDGWREMYGQIRASGIKQNKTRGQEPLWKEVKFQRP